MSYCRELYKETFNTAANEGHKAFDKLEHESKSAFHKVAELPERRRRNGFGANATVNLI
jgi:hypothetical protein